ncbi:hypothetical protein EMGBS15_13890 [Filimonas sp.]|nr:hypothetical protein EMGBS15_13890 [Filimonas sp.]
MSGGKNFKVLVVQIIGWLCFALVNVYIAILTQELTREVLLINILIAIIGLLLIHLFRNYILSTGLPSFKTERY